MQLADAAGLREQAKRFQDAAKKLIAAADALDGQSNGSSDDESLDSERPLRIIKAKRNRKGAKRLAQLRKFLAKNGPSTRKEIIALSDLPMGTIAYLLKVGNGFKKEDGKKWSNVAQE